MQSQVRFNRVPEKVWEALVQPGQVQQGSGFRGYGEGSGERPGQGGHSTHPAEVFPALGFAACFRKICNDKTLQRLGIPPKLIFSESCILWTPGFFYSIGRAARHGLALGDHNCGPLRSMSRTPGSLLRCDTGGQTCSEVQVCAKTWGARSAIRGGPVGIRMVQVWGAPTDWLVIFVEEKLSHFGMGQSCLDG